MRKFFKCERCDVKRPCYASVCDNDFLAEELPCLVDPDEPATENTVLFKEVTKLDYLEGLQED